MPNILINPSSGILEFNTGIAGGSVFDTSLSGAARLTFNSGEINLVSYSTGVTDRFTVDGAAGRLFSVSDALTGSIFSVNDIAGLPLIEVVSTTGDTITIGPYNTNTLVVKDTRVGIGTGIPSSKLQIVDTTSGSISPVLHLEETWNTTGIGTGIYLNITDSGANSASSLLNARINNSNIFSVRKDGMIIVPSTVGIQSLSNASTKFIMAGDQWGIYMNGSGPSFFTSANPTTWTVGVNGGFAWSQGSYANDTRDIYLMRDAAGIIAQSNGVNPQTFRIYNTYSTTGSFERGKIGWNSNVLEIGTEQGATGGSPRNLALITSGQQRFTVTSDGNVGVGTSTPSSNLEVYGATKIASARNNQFPLTIYGGNSSAQACHVLLYNNVTRGVLKAGGNGLDGQGFADSSYNYLLFVSGNGNVGVGTTSPSYKLDVDGTGNFRSGLYSNGNPVLTTASSNVVFTTGNQTISGEKNFANTAEFSNASSLFKCNGGIANNGLQLYKIGNYYSFRAGETGYWGDGSTQVTLGTLNEPGFTVYDYINGGTFQIGHSYTAGAYNGSTIRMGPDGIGIWGNDGGDIVIANGGVAINTNGGSPSYGLEVSGSIKGNEYFSSVGNSGITTSITVYDQNAAMNKTLNFENGLLVSVT